MKRINNLLCIFPMLIVFGLFGYTHKAPPVGDIESVYIKTVENKIDLSAEVTEQSEYKAYRPGLEIDITKAVINRFLYDGNMKIVPEEKADAILTGDLVDYSRQALRYSTDQFIEEFRVNVTVDFKLVDRRSEEKKILWQARLAGDSSQLVSGKFSKSETQAIDDALSDLARRVVEETFKEEW